ncbi:hypothetical protein [Oceanospirillum linum]|uniref:Lipoprotein n=1 Tax=Oceanospirillum linum TaxID=966 RepID=A0A1T1HE28_OCELI|nr:hypothetical protein [Oceanospirillum linum]OOV87990.1 hypothetical protein BTA35_0200035 [Oceanospirillum linum]SEF39710.1 hypothetical protein SAMN04489856_1016 [Oleiphilus messinensis]SMP00361.1 hypothetical protein SAMN06264348_1017 [Oceanospirillum linum]
MKKYKIIMISLLALLAGCTSAPKYAPLLSMPVIPEDKVDLIDVDVKFDDKIDIYDNVVQNFSRNIDSGSSIVINVPSKLFEEQAESNAINQDFKTKDFFNLAEQQIEKELIRKGFDVLSRSKFEAKLRTLRDESRCNLNEFRCLHSQVAPEIQPVLEELKRKYDDKEINSIEYADEIKLFKDKLQSASAGKTRQEGDKELTDISEVIRAAESGDIKADYILQINLFDTEKKTSIYKDLRHISSVREFVRKNPGIKSDFESNENSIVRCAVISSQLNAKLIYVKTGAITWIGEHELNEFSSGVHDLSVEMGSREYVSNLGDIRRFVSDNNTSIARQNRFGKSVDFPSFEYSVDLLKPSISSGRCEKKWTNSREVRSQLARQVAKDLIATIKVN